MSGEEGGKKKVVGEYWKTYRASPVSRLVNPELHAKPNVAVAALGTAAFVLILGNLAWTKFCHERDLAKARTPPARLEYVIAEDE